MKKLRCVITVAAFAVCMAACSGSKNTGTGTTTDPSMQSPSSTTPATTDTSGMSNTTRDSTQQK